MNLINNINWINVLIAGSFLVPILLGLFSPFHSNRIRESFWSLMNSLEVVVAIFLSIYIAREILSHNQTAITTTLYNIIPSLRNINISILLIIALFFIINSLFRLILLPVYRHVLVPLSERLAAPISKLNSGFKHLISAAWELPKAICAVLIITLILYYYPNYIASPVLTESIDNSAAYNFVDKNILAPLLNSGIAKEIPVILNDSFKGDSGSQSEIKRNTLVITYFNGVTLDEAIKTNDEINAAAKKIVAGKSTDKDKAFLIYQWISKNIKYDKTKIVSVVKNPSKVSSGAIVAYSTKSGICFDYSCLYVAMCRAVNLKVRFISGLGYDGSSWGDHAWNQVYSSEENRWINVDSTFGSVGLNYFDRQNFSSDHADAEIDGEW